MTLNAYQSVRKATLLEGSSPHQLIGMLYEGALSNIAIAKQHLNSNNRHGFHLHVDKAIAIVQELQGSLKDHETNELSGNLFDLYSFIVYTLFESDRTLDSKGFDTCIQIIKTLNEAWQMIAPERAAA